LTSFGGLGLSGIIFSTCADAAIEKRKISMGRSLFMKIIYRR